MLKLLRYLRHGPLRCFDTVWLFLGRIYRSSLAKISLINAVQMCVGNYGPFKFNPQFAFSNFKQWGEGHNNGFTACIEMCRNKHCVVDVGAHIGLVTMPMSSVIAKNGRVVAVEPAAMNLKYLREHLAKNYIDNVDLYDCLLGGEEKQNIAFFEQNTATGMNSVVVKKNHNHYIKKYKDQKTLDVIFQENALAPEVIKIDVEGAEINVLRGAINTIKKYQPIIFLSVHPAEIKLLRQSLDELKTLILSLGYRAMNIDGSPINEFALKEYILQPE